MTHDPASVRGWNQHSRRHLNIPQSDDPSLIASDGAIKCYCYSAVRSQIGPSRTSGEVRVESADMACDFKVGLELAVGHGRVYRLVSHDITPG
jgi:hypothetical protein